MEASLPPPFLTLTSPDGVDIPLPTIPVEENVSNQEKGKQRAVPNGNDVPLVPHAMEGKGCQTAKRMSVHSDEAGNV